MKNKFILLGLGVSLLGGIALIVAFIIIPRSSPEPVSLDELSDSHKLHIYNDGLPTQWADWSWGSTIDFNHTSLVQNGSDAIAVTYNEPWVAFYLHTDNAIIKEGYHSLRFWLHGGESGGQQLHVMLADQNAQLLERSAVSVSPQAGTWTQVEIKLSDLGDPPAITGLVLQDTLGEAQPTFYIDEVTLVGSAPPERPSSAPSSELDSNQQTTIYSDSLPTQWANWSWGSTIDFDDTDTDTNSAQDENGSGIIGVTYHEAEVAFYLHTDNAIVSAGYDSLRFWVHGGESGDQQLQVMLADQNVNLLESHAVLVSPQAGKWTEVEIKLSDLGNPPGISGLLWQDASGGAQSTFYIDEVALVGRGISDTPSQLSFSPGPELMVDVNGAQHPINPNIYGLNFADEALAADLRLPINRWGGNATTRYSWQNDTSNRASDWFFENIPNDNENADQLPVGSSSDKFVEQNLATGTSSLLTMPLIGWTPNSRDNRACGFSLSKYGPQQEQDPWNPDCGNGVKEDGSLIIDNDPLDTSIPIDPTFVQDWMKHLTERYGKADAGGVKFYSLDNEPMLWPHAHRDVHPHATSYDEIRDLTYQYAAAIKESDPSAQTLGPVLWGWSAYFYSARDLEDNDSWFNRYPDHKAHDRIPFVEWYLQQMKRYEDENGLRILDYLDLHYYPQSQGVTLASAGNGKTQALRLRSTRSLWDPTYHDESWIDEPIQLLPLMRQWVDAHYPGTKLALSEYNWGGLEHINGALAQADVLGIFGREALDLATLWDPPEFDQPGAFAFRMYRNYDGEGSAFGDISLSATSADQEQLAIYAAGRRRDNALTLIVINKSWYNLTSNISLAGIQPAANAEVYRYSSANLSAIVREPEQAVSASGFEANLPANSITLFVLGAREK